MKFKIKPVGVLVVFAVFTSLLLFQNFTWTGSETLSGAKKCSSAKLQEILAKASDSAPSVKIDCSFALRAQDTVTKNLNIEGAEASGVTIDCNQASLKGSVMISSVNTKNPSLPYGWSRPEKIVVSACKILGTMRIRGFGNNGEALAVRESSVLDTKHTLRAQAVAPRQILLENITFVAEGGIPLYIAPGTTQVTVQASTFTGKTNSVAIYLDAESASNRIVQNKFNIGTSRELIAIDGSANNLITKNEFTPNKQPSIHLYRNCGEGGTVRHQPPTDNVISSNTFYQDTDESIFVGSRSGRSDFCENDAGYSFGSSKDDRDLADNNKIVGNHFVVNKDRKFAYISRYVVINTYKTTEISKNKISMGSEEDLEFAKRIYGQFVDGGGNNIKKIPIPRTNVKFECSASTNNAGCFKTVLCPNNRKIISGKAACNLESTSLVTWSKINTIDENSLEVLKVSDHPSDGTCQMDTLKISASEKSFNIAGKKSIQIGCREHDKNGGDCIIRGVLSCEI